MNRLFDDFSRGFGLAPFGQERLNFPDAYVLRPATFCEGNDVAAIASDLDHALPFIDNSFTRKETIGSLLSMRAKMEYAAGNYVGAMDGLEKAVRADLHRRRHGSAIILSESYGTTALPVVNEQLRKAGVRLAEVLNEALP